MKFDIVDLIGCLSIGVNENLSHSFFTMNWCEKKLINWLIVKRGLATPLAYMQRAAWKKYVENNLP